MVEVDLKVIFVDLSIDTRLWLPYCIHISDKTVTCVSFAARKGKKKSLQS